MLKVKAGLLWQITAIQVAIQGECLGIDYWAARRETAFKLREEREAVARNLTRGMSVKKFMRYLNLRFRAAFTEQHFIVRHSQLFVFP